MERRTRKSRARKNIRVLARKTVYYYVDVVAKNKVEAMGKAWDIPEEGFMKKECPQNQWKILDAVLMDKDGADDLQYLAKTSK